MLLKFEIYILYIHKYLFLLGFSLQENICHCIPYDEILI